jgi:hypothetical protein
VAALFTMLLVKNREVLGGIPAHRIRAIVFAPPRIMSLDLSEKYSPHLNSIIYQANASLNTSCGVFNEVVLFRTTLGRPGI